MLNKVKKPLAEAKYALNVEKFAKKYRGNKEYSVDHVSFQVKPGEFHGFIGSNGAGKTTTIKSLVGAYAKFEGNVQIFGQKSDSIAAKKHIGYIPEKADFPKELSVFQYIWRMAQLTGFSKKSAQKLADQEIKKMGLSKFRNVSPLKLSSGQKKKVLLAQALVHNPDLIIMDEPAANLDPKARSDFFATLKKLQKAGKSIFMSSHILAELQEFIDSATILDHGKVLYSGTIAELKENKNLKYQVQFKTATEAKTFLSFLNKINCKHTPLANGFEVIFLKTTNMQKALQFIVKNQLVLINFTAAVKSLQQIYDQIVAQGGTNA